MFVSVLSIQFSRGYTHRQIKNEREDKEGKSGDKKEDKKDKNPKPPSLSELLHKSLKFEEDWKAFPRSGIALNELTPFLAILSFL